MSYTPIALFVYNRPHHLRQTVESLLANPEARESKLFVFSDGAKDAKDTRSISEVRQYINQISGFSAVHYLERDENYGLSRSIISGVSQVCGEYGRVIVLEDDMVTSSHFLKYMNDALSLYEQDERVISIHGYVYPVTVPLPETFFLRGADCWGWATWQRGWALFEADGIKLLTELEARHLTHAFDFNGSYPFTRMLREQIKGLNDSWAIRWYASAFLKEKFTLYPCRSLIRNIGNDGLGTHCSANFMFDVKLNNMPIQLQPQQVIEDVRVHAIYTDFFRRIRLSRFERFRNRLQHWLHRHG